MANPDSKLLLRSPNWLGDAVMTLPAVQQLTTLGYRPSVLCQEKLMDFWRLIPHIQEIIPVQKKKFATAKLLHVKKFDTAILFPNSFSSALEVLLARIPHRYGFHGHRRRWLLTKSCARPTQINGYIHQAKHNLFLLQQLGIPIPVDSKQLLSTAPLTPTEISQTLRFQSIPKPDPCSLAPKRPYLALCPGAEYGPAKRWLTERYAQTVNQVLAKHDLEIIILGTVKDQPIASQLAAQINRPVHNLCGQINLAEFLALMAHANLALVNDSGAMHVAAMFGTPSVAIFGSTEPRLTSPINSSVTVLREHVPCSPCFLRICPFKDQLCMLAISVDQVADACLKRL